MNHGLKPETIEKICGVLKQFPELDSAILYGSRAMGSYHAGSDIDLALQGGGVDLRVLSRIANALDDLLLPYSFDLATYQDIENKELLEHIARVGIVFYPLL